MNSILIIKDTHPTRDFSNITQLGLKALNLAVTHETKIEVRLPGTIDALKTDLKAMGAVIPGALQAHHEAMASTTAQNTLIRQGYERIRAIRETVRKSGAPADVRRAYGVGQFVAPERLRDVKAGLQQIVDRATGAPQEAATFGLIAEDVEALVKFVDELAAMDLDQETKRANAPLTTKERNKTANRILQAVVLIAGAGRIAFVDDPATFASFAALMAKSKRPPKPKTPKAKAPEAKASEAKASEASSPEVGAPEAKASEARASEAKASEAKASEAATSVESPKVPDTAVSKGSAPVTDVAAV